MKINVELVDNVAEIEEKTEEILRPIYKWKEEWGEHINGELSLDKDEVKILGHKSVVSVIIDIPLGKDERLSFLCLEDLVDSLTSNTRRVYFDEEDIFLTLKNIPEEEYLRDIVDEWEEKWKRGKNPFSVAVHQWDEMTYALFITFGRKFTVYQIQDLLSEDVIDKGNMCLSR